jgi:hypothetical protein
MRVSDKYEGLNPMNRLSFFSILFLLYFIPHGHAQGTYGPDTISDTLKKCESELSRMKLDNKTYKKEDVEAMQRRCDELTKLNANQEYQNQGTDEKISQIESNGQSIQKQCDEFKKLKNEKPNDKDLQKKDGTCEDLKALTKVAGNSWSSARGPDVEKSTKKSMPGPGGVLECKNPAIYTIDYKPCLNILALYSSVIAAEQAMDLQQKIRRDQKDKSINEETARKAAEGDTQEAAYDGMVAKHNHEKSLNSEKMVAYGAAVAALMGAYAMLPSTGDAVKKCKSLRQTAPPQNCDQTVNDYPEVIANDDNKAKLATAIAHFLAKAAAAGIAMQEHLNAAKATKKVKKTFDGDVAADLMIDRCQFNPADPACIDPSKKVRTKGPGAQSSDFGVGDGSVNSFNLNPEGAPFGEPGAETDLGDMNAVSSPNSPFKGEAEKANGILNPAAAAQVQATGGAGGGFGGGGGGGGAGGASLGNDLEGKKEASTEPELKTNKVSGIYDSAGGAGYKAIGKGKGDDANPFASLFDQKGPAGGVEEDRSIASDDIGDKDMDLFQKISRRYGLIQADKRIEVNNLE